MTYGPKLVPKRGHRWSVDQIVVRRLPVTVRRCFVANEVLDQTLRRC
jgi:hypothetical protein